MTEEIRITMENLQKNGMKPFYVKTKDEVVPLIKTLVEKGSSVSHGGSETLKQTGIVELLKTAIMIILTARVLRVKNCGKVISVLLGVIRTFHRQMQLQ